MFLFIKETLWGGKWMCMCSLYRLNIWEGEMRNIMLLMLWVSILSDRKRRASHCRLVQIFDLLPGTLRPLAEEVKVIYWTFILCKYRPVWFSEQVERTSWYSVNTLYLCGGLIAEVLLKFQSPWVLRCVEWWIVFDVSKAPPYVWRVESRTFFWNFCRYLPVDTTWRLRILESYGRSFLSTPQ